MKILQRLYLKDFFKLLLLLSIGLSLIFSLVDMTGRIDDFIGGKSSASLLAAYAGLNVPRFFIYLLPMSVLICSLYTFSQAARRKEIIAIKSAGGQLKKLFLPFVITGVILSVMAFSISEFIVPVSSLKAADIRNRLEGKTRRFTSANGFIWLKTKSGFPVKIELYVPENKAITNVNIFVYGRDFLKEQIIADRGFWNGQSWSLENVTRYDIETGKIEMFNKMDYSDLESPEIFTGEFKTPEQMDINELYRYIKRLKNAGFNNIKLLVDINSKVSFPLINIVMMLLGMSLSIRGHMGGGLFAAGMGLIISLSYWFSHTFSLSLGYAGIVHPLIAAWIVPVMFSMFSVYLFINIPE